MVFLRRNVVLLRPFIGSELICLLSTSSVLNMVLIILDILDIGSILTDNSAEGCIIVVCTLVGSERYALSYSIYLTIKFLIFVD